MIAAGELIVDSFAGGGGASLAIEMALGRGPDIAINHAPEAVAMHRANHPATEHFCQNVWQVDPADVRRRGPVGLAWFSPDCCHHSKAKGGQPRQRHLRDLAWVVVLWAERARPRVICLENVEEFADWGPLGGDGRPCPDRRGTTFRRWVRELRRLGYRVEWRELRACDYGAPTIRKRLFLVARCDGAPIAWPAPTHGPGRLPYRTAAECLDWSLPCPSIFLTREEGRALGVNRPLAEATMRRIAAGIRRFVIEAAAPFIVPVTHRGGDRCQSALEPLRTVTTAHRGEFALVAAHLSPYYGERRAGDARAHAVDDPLRTQTAENRFALVAAFLAQHNGGAVGHPASAPVSTILGRGTQQALVASHLVKLRGTCRDGQKVDRPAPTVTAGGWHLGEVRAFLVKYFGSAEHGQPLAEPLHTATTKARFGLVTVAGEDWQIADIGMRMLSPRELFRAQGFPDSYVIDPEHDGRPLSKTAQIRCCGNSVSPPPAAALLRAQFPAGAAERRAA